MIGSTQARTRVPAAAGAPRVTVYDATVGHTRRIEPRTRFTHRLRMWLVDLDDPPRLPWWCRPFARFDARDHFAASDPSSVRAKLDEWLAVRGVRLDGGRVLMLATPRAYGRVFNPITVYWCHRPDGTPSCVVAEVHNTYGGRHAYLLWPDGDGETFAGKEFAVSPFQRNEGEYRLRVPAPGPLLEVGVAFTPADADGPALVASLRGVRRTVPVAALARMLLSDPPVPLRIPALIRRHGIGLFARRAPRPRGVDWSGGLDG